ncbi:MAG: hypothetical protein JXB23_07125 [Candidatus Aminicenantes bacterium]|nr:hypothetical protein [Candidatus Aminicenantes bacterium]
MRLSAKHQILLLCCFFIPLSIILSDCKKESHPGISTYESGSRVGPAGGIVRDAAGAFVAIPAGALAAETEISVMTYRDGSALPEKMWSSFFGELGAAEFLPDGIKFNAPVTITIPSPVPLPPGKEAPLFRWNENDRAWEQTEFTAVVNPDGLSYSANVNHFTTFSAYGFGNFPSPGFGSLDDPGSLDPDAVKAALEQRFSQWIDEYERSCHHLGETDRRGNCVMEIGGFRFHMTYDQGKFHYESDREKGQVNVADKQEVQTFNYGPPDGAYRYHFKVVICWTALLVRLKLKATPNYIRIPLEGPAKATRARVEATVEFIKRNGDKSTYSGFIVEFSLSGPGDVGPDSAITDGAGVAFVKYIPEESGVAHITATVKNCEGFPSAPKTKAETAIYVASSIWGVTAKFGFTEGGKVPWSFSDEVIIYVPFTIDEDGKVKSGEDGEGGHEKLSITMKHKDCTIRNIQAPKFKATATGNLKDRTLHIKIQPEKPLELSFDIYGGDLYKVFLYPVVHYGVNEWALICKHLEAELFLVQGESTDSIAEHGYEEFGDSLLRYAFLLWINDESQQRSANENEK